MVKTKQLGSTEELVSMLIGLAVIVAVGWLIVGYVKRSRGNIDVPGIMTSTIKKTEVVAEITSAPVGRSNEYVVKKGDSLWKIAKNNYGDGYKYTEIIKVNKLINPGDLLIGQKIVLPHLADEKLSESKSASLVKSEYVVVKYDSLWKISLRSYGDGFAWVKLWQANKGVIKDPNKIEVGMKLALPKL